MTPTTQTPLKYTGTVQPGTKESAKNGLFPYLPSPELVEAVNLTIFLEKRPLLLKGEPGSGKTRLARMVAYELGLPYEEWHVKSVSRARDGLYHYDAVLRLHDSQLAHKDPTLAEKVKDPAKYIIKRPLGRTFENKKRTVLLIDEIDKADIDFPNDLLLELDQQRFYIEETGEEVKAKEPPIVFITSNDEKDLPDAFLRRCLFFYIQFPSMPQLVDIINAHFPASPSKVVTRVAERFLELRRQMEQERAAAGKKVSTSELLDWFELLRRFPEDMALEKLRGEIPFPGALLKSWEDHRRYLKQDTTGKK